MKNKRPIIVVLTTAILLLIPLIAMQFTNEVNWTFSDFVVAGSLLLGAGFLFDLIVRKVHKINYRIAFLIAVVVILILTWIELAVGIFGSPFAGN